MTDRAQGSDPDDRGASPERATRRPDPAYGPEAALVSAVVRVKGRDGVVAGAGFLVTDDLVLTCAHVVSDALGRPRDQEVEPGAEVVVDLPLAGVAGGTHDVGDRTAEVRRWVSVRSDRGGDIALLRLPEPIPGSRPLPMAAPPEGVWHHTARTVGFTDDHPGGIWHSGTFRGPTGEGWIQLSRGDTEGVYVEPGFSGSPVWDHELGAAVGLMVAAGAGRGAQQVFALRTRTVLAALPELVPLVTPRSPFRGLETFQEADADIFFGRSSDAGRVVAALDDHPTVVLCGPSGCGKSSLALAGVVPRMREAGYAVVVVDAGDVVSLRSALATELFKLVGAPGTEPAEEPGNPHEEPGNPHQEPANPTEAAGPESSGTGRRSRVRSAEGLESLLKEKGLADALHRARGSTTPRVLVVVDQAEALLDRSKDEVASAARLLFPASGTRSIRVLLTLRADFLDTALSRPRLGAAMEGAHTVPLAPMSKGQLAEAISGPLRRLPAVAYDPGLEQRILRDAGDAPGVLPLLGFVLSQLWERQASGRLRLETYEEIGGVSGALARHAEKAWGECVGPEDKADALRLLTGLVRVLPGSEARLRRMITYEEAGETRWRIAQSLAEKRLLVLHGEEHGPQTAELAHETLISAWPTLADQVKAESDLLAARAELRHDLDRWERSGRSPDLLPGPLHLTALRRRLPEHPGELSREEAEFIALARRRHRHRRGRARAGWVAAALVLALIVGLGTFLVQESGVRAVREAEGRSRSLATLSDELAKRDPGAAALVAMAAHDLSPTTEARNALLRRHDHFVLSRWALSGTEAKVDQVATSPDGRVVFVTTKAGGSVSSDGGAVLFVRGADDRVVRARLPLAEQAFFPMVSRDGRRIAYLSTKDGGTLVWHDVDPAGADESAVLGRERKILGKEFGEPGTTLYQRHGLADFSPDGREIVTATDGRVRIRELTTRRTRELPGRLPAVDRAWFGSDADTLVTHLRPDARQEKDGTATLVAVDTGTGRTRTLATGVSASGAPRFALSGNGAVLAVCRQDRSGSDVAYEAVRVADGRMLIRHSTGKFSSSCRSIAIDGTGDHFAVNTVGPTWHVVGTRPGGKVREALGPSSLPRLDENDLSLVGDPEEPVLIVPDETSVTGRPLGWNTIKADSPPVLLSGAAWAQGGETVVRLGDKGDSLGIVRMDSEESTLVKEVKRPPRKSRTDFIEDMPEVKADRNGTLAADLIGPGKVRVWELPSLRTATDIATEPPPEGENVRIFFAPRDELLTISGSVIEHWNARDGRRLSKPIDVRALGLTLTNPPRFTASPHPEPGHVQLLIAGEPRVRAISLRTGKENKGLRVELEPDTATAMLDRSGDFAVVQTKGLMLEVWSVRPAGQPPRRVLGPVGPLPGFGFQHGFRGDSSVYFLANETSIRFQDVADREDRGDSYVFAEEQEFLAASHDGRTLLRRINKGNVDFLQLDPKLWKSKLCDTLGRDLTEDERRGLPAWLPERICPPGGR